MDLDLDPLPHISLIAASLMAVLHQDRTRLPTDQMTFLVEKVCVSHPKVQKHTLGTLEVVSYSEVEAVSFRAIGTQEMQEMDFSTEEKVSETGIAENLRTFETGGLLPQTLIDQGHPIPTPFVMRETRPLAMQTYPVVMA